LDLRVRRQRQGRCRPLRRPPLALEDTRLAWYVRTVAHRNKSFEIAVVKGREKREELWTKVGFSAANSAGRRGVFVSPEKRKIMIMIY
jgi:hypothetical protein